MFLELIAVIFAGIAAAGAVMLANKLAAGRLPRWLAPVAAGLVMIGVTIASEYGWYARTKAALPEGIEVAETNENRSLYRPWTYLVPYVDRFAAVDTASLLQHPDLPGQHLGDLYFFGRWAPVSKAPALLDCAGWRRALLPPGAEFAASGEAHSLDWVTPARDDAILTTVCGG
ncbi:hypothetical protein ACUXV3_02755 [Roseobacteraceae bacterium NS-SX3]